MKRNDTEEIEFRYTNENLLLDPDSWTESSQNSMAHGPDPLSEIQRGSTFTILFCLCKSKNLSSRKFLNKYFLIELSISIFSILISLGITVFGLTFFSIQERFAKDREFISLLGGIFGLGFFGFKFYTTVISLKMLKKKSYSKLMGFAVGLSIIGHFFSLIAGGLLIFGCLKQGIYDYNDAKGTKKELEFYTGIFLIALSFPLFLYLILVCGQWYLGREANECLDKYLRNSIAEMKKKEIENKKKREREERIRKVAI